MVSDLHRVRGLALGALALLLALLTGCAETVYLTSRPAGANVYINDEAVGRTPMNYSVVPAKWKPPFRYRVERPGYLPAEGELATRISEGRVMGGIFSLGLSLFFKQPDTFAEEAIAFDLVPAPTGLDGSRTGPRTPPRTAPRPVPGPPSVPYAPPTVPSDTYPEEPPPARLAPAPTPSPRPRPTPSPARPKPTPSPKKTAKPAPPTATSAPEPEPPPAPAAAEPGAPGQSPEVQAELERLRHLRDEGVIVDAEYEQLRDSVLKGN
jgi:hypothetical protein